MGTKLPTSRRVLLGIALIIGLSLVLAIQLFLDDRPAHRPWSVPDLIKAVQRQETWWDRTRLTLWSYASGFLHASLSRLKPAAASEIRCGACRELQRLGPDAAPAVPVLTRALRDPEVSVRFEAVRALRAIGPAAAGARNRLLELVGVPSNWVNASTFGVTHLDDMPAFIRKVRWKADPVSSFVYDQLSPETRQALVNYQEPGADPLRKRADPLLPFLSDQLSPQTRQALAKCQDPGVDPERLRENLMQDLCRIIGGPPIYEPQRFAHVRLRPMTRYLLIRPAPGFKQARLNRWLLEDAYPRELAKFTPHRLLMAIVDMRSEAALTLAVIVPQDPEVIAMLLEDFESVQSPDSDAVAERLHRSTYARQVFEEAVNRASVNVTTNIDQE